MNYYEQLQEILCTDESIKADIMELRFWTKIKYEEQWVIKTRIVLFVHKYSDFLIVEPWYNYRTPKKILRRIVSNIIWNPLEERHLRMYCENLNWDYLKQRMDWDFEWIPQWEWEVNDRLFWLDNTKPFHQQTEEVYKSIVEFLEDNK